MSIPRPRLLDKTMHEVRRLNPTKVSITLMLTPLSTASMTLPNGEPAISVGDFIELFIPSGSAGIFRVSKASTDYMTGKQNINLEHGIVTMSDATVFGKHQFFGYDEGGDEDTTITGFISTFTLHYTSGRLEVSEMGAHNDDGSHYGVSFLNTLGIVPIVTKGDSGWVTVLNQSVFDQASSIYGTWDGVVRSSTLSTNLGCICRPYSNATGTIVKSESLYDNPRVGGMYISPRSVYPGQRVFVLGDCNYKAAYSQEEKWAIVETENGSRGYVSFDNVVLDPGYVIIDPEGEIPNQFAYVANQMMAYSHNQRTNWEFGESDFTESYGYKFENVNLLEAVLSLPDKLTDGYVWEFDQTQLPWRLNLRRMDRQGIAELRMSRNLSAMQISIDMSDVVTCVCPIGADGLTVASVNDGETYMTDAGNEELYGHIEKIVEFDDAQANKLYESGLKYLSDHGEPVVNVSVSALDLSEMTGEPLDRLTIGKMCRIPLPKDGITVNDYITKLSWSDVYGAPTKVAVTLANSPRTASDLIARLLKGG